MFFVHYSWSWRIALDIGILYGDPGKVQALFFFMCTGKSATGKSEMVAVLCGRTFAGLLKVALLPIDINKSTTLQYDKK